MSDVRVFVSLCAQVSLHSTNSSIKTQLQSQSQNAQIAVGYQHQHSGMMTAIKSAWTTGGTRGLWRGASAAMVRVSAGSSVQLSTFSKAKSLIVQHFPLMGDHTLGCAFLASMLSGTALCVVMTPFDVVCTRLYNQGLNPKTSKGLYYHGFVDCFSKILLSEGLQGFYKGVSAAFVRCGPHTVITLMLWEVLRDLDFSLRAESTVVSLTSPQKLPA